MLELNKVYNMDCLEGMKQIEDNSIDSIVTDPPYDLTSQRVYSTKKEINNIKGTGQLRKNIENNTAYGSMVKGFMGKEWDGTKIAFNINTWKEAYRILKPGGYLLSFGGTRTYHRMASAIEDAGFEIRDMINWTYGSGFPKSLNIGKAIDKLQGNDREVIGSEKKAKPTFHSQNVGGKIIKIDNIELTKGTSEWEGWGTALKPAHEPICMARKPLSERTVVENVLKYGTGGINIDESRIEATKEDMGNWDRFKGHQNNNTIRKNMVDNKTENFIDRVDNGINNSGRFPANFIHDGSPEVLQEFEKAGVSSPGHWANTKVTGFGAFGNGKSEYFGVGRKCEAGTPARFFKSCEFEIEDAPSFIYIAKASKGERNKGCEELEDSIGGGMVGTQEQTLLTGSGNIRNNITKNNHPTVKPIKLMEYLVKLVTRKDGIVLDPFIGSGTTAVACAKNGYKFIGFEKEKEYIEIINARLKPYIEQTRLFKVE